MVATGAAEAAREVGTTTEAVRDLSAAEAERADEERAGEWTAERAEKAKLGRLRDVGLALGGIAAATQFARASFDRLAEAAGNVDMEKLTRVDPNSARELQNIVDVAQYVQSPLSMLQELYERLLMDGSTAAEEVAKINEGLRVGEATHAAIIQGILDRGVVQADALKKLASEVAAANRFLNAKDSADSAADAREDARKIQEGKDPQEVEKAAAERDAQRQVARLEREQKARESAAAQESANADQLARNAYRVMSNPGATDEDRVNAGREAEAAATKAAEANREADTARRITEERIRETREREAARKEAATAAQEERQREMDARHAEDNERLERAASTAAEREKMQGMLGAGKSRLGTLAEGASRDFTAAAERAPTKATSAAFSNIGKKLQDGTDGREIDALIREFQNAVGQSKSATVEGFREMLSAIQKQARDIEQMKEQIRNGNRK